eukprot:TRINITY_DN52971_c0_g1_i1.p1 TRINITY_DN52971_c0_g1~~TRINITY_DN52971_c0_g1_i1.p1  ORF type:complete len:518 (-),score=66.53 TRINITY_DN52971_c0_g1_i1:36-1562(-)
MALQWHYLDSDSKEFGPFDGQQMRGWFDHGYFHAASDNLLVRLPEWRQFKRLGEIYAGDRSAYFIAPPRPFEGPPARERSRSPRGHPSHGNGGAYTQALALPAPSPYAPPPAPSAHWPPPAHPHPHPHAHPPPHPHYFHPPPAPWGPPPSPYGVPPAHLPPPHPAPYGRPYGLPHHGPPPTLGYGAMPPLPDYRRRSPRRSPRRGDREERGPRGGGKKNQPSEEDLANELRKLGHEGARKLLTDTLQSLYKDRIKPLGNYVKGRLKEQSAPEAVIRAFIDVFSRHPDLFDVQKEDSAAGTEATIFLWSEPDWFQGWVDMDSAEDPYDEDLWESFKAFVEEGHEFAGGRYGMARDLVKRKLPFLSELTLGEVCHVVQLAIQHKKILVYHRKMLKTMTAILPSGDGNSKGDGDGEEIPSLLELCRVLFKILKANKEGVRLDRMKKWIKDEGFSLNEMAFGCPKLMELFEKEPLKSTFELEKDGQAFWIRTANPKGFCEDIRRIRAEVHRS